jgi:hypothetical protein
MRLSVRDLNDWNRNLLPEKSLWPIERQDPAALEALFGSCPVQIISMGGAFSIQDQHERKFGTGAYHERTRGRHARLFRLSGRSIFSNAPRQSRIGRSAHDTLGLLPTGMTGLGKNGRSLRQAGKAIFDPSRTVCCPATSRSEAVESD